MTPDITVANVKEYIKDGRVRLPGHAVYVGRFNGRYGLPHSPLHNRAKIGEVENDGTIVTRKKAVFYFSILFIVAMGAKRPTSKIKEFRREVDRLWAVYEKYGKLILVCWCYPKLCHAGVIVLYMLAELKKKKRKKIPRRVEK